ncbi:RecQ family zinc-binding domain-containing protein [Singulisphaera sp. GP187]|nr:RecQ family zinc-binding domain-containing protein [Singulisphaera sp. GP187]
MHEVLEFAQEGGCLTRALLSYFGEELEEDCGHCNRCEGMV